MMISSHEEEIQYGSMRIAVNLESEADQPKIYKIRNEERAVTGEFSKRQGESK